MKQHEMVNTEPIEQLVKRIGADTVFGTPTTENGVVIIPVAQAEFGFGYGGGYGHGPNGTAAVAEDAAETDDAAEGSGAEGGSGEGGSGEGGGGGGGAGGRATPRGYIRITPDKVKYEPITDETRIPLAGIVMVAWSVFWIMATVRTIAKAVAKTKQMRLKGA